MALPTPRITLVKKPSQVAGSCNVSNCRDEGPVYEVNLGYLVLRLCMAHAHMLRNMIPRK